MYALGTLYFGDLPYGNPVVHRGLGGRGGGAVHLTGHHMELDGEITANGEASEGTYTRLAGQSGLCLYTYTSVVNFSNLL